MLDVDGGGKIHFNDLLSSVKEVSQRFEAFQGAGLGTAHRQPSWGFVGEGCLPEKPAQLVIMKATALVLIPSLPPTVDNCDRDMH